jgi:hypothetical protein
MKRQVLDPALQEIHDRVASAEELARFLATPITEEEVESTAELVRWFTRRYPTARERFAYARRAYARALTRSNVMAAQGRSSHEGR